MRHILAVLTVSVLGVGCVGTGTHRAVVEERDLLAGRVRLLEASNQSLDSERVALLDGVEDLRIARASLEKDLERLQAESESLGKSLAARTAELAAQQTEVARLRGTYRALVADLESEVAAGQIQIQHLRDGLQVNVSDEILFASGSARLAPQGRAVLEKVAKQLASLQHQVQVAGHADNIAIRGALTKRYPTNWELAGARAASVVRLFEKWIDPSRLVAMSYGPNRPVASNDTEEGRALNRRIGILLRPIQPSLAQQVSEDEVASEDRVDAAGEADESDDAGPPSS